MNDYPQENCKDLATCEMPRQLSPTEMLYAKRERLNHDLAETEEAIKALEENPALANALHLVGKALGRRY